MNESLSRDYHDSRLEALREKFDDMVSRMQTLKARQAAASIGTVKPATLDKAAQRSSGGHA